LTIGLAALLSIPASAQAAPDASCPGPANNSVAFDGEDRLAQTFTALNSGVLSRAQMETVKIGSPGNWVMSINAVDGSGRPTNTVLASTTILDATVPSGDTTLAAEFVPPAIVAAGQQYALVITRPASDSVAMRYRDDNPCPGGFFNSPSQTGPFGAPSALDFMFAVFVEPDCDSDGLGDETQDPDIASCGPPTKVSRTLSLDANKGKVEKGRKVRLTGQIDAPQNEAACEPNQTIELQRRAKKAPDTAFTTFKTVQTDQAGNFAEKVKVKKTRIYRAVVNESEACDDELSNTQKVRVQKKKAAKEA
jgi:hypothetical protein